jgi:S1-C subfamily serine protease
MGVNPHRPSFALLIKEGAQLIMTVWCHNARQLVRPVLAALLLVLWATPASAQERTVNDLVSAVVRIKTYINPDARTGDNLGHQREGSGVVLDSNGLVLTIGYLMVEAHAAEVVTLEGRTVPANIVGYDHETGFGLLQASMPLNVTPMPMGSSAEVKQQDQLLVVSHGGAGRVGAVIVVSKREFAGSWEYLLPDAIFTAPPHPTWSGAALVNREGRLVGIGSLVVGDASGQGVRMPGNMFVPIDLLPPILGDLMANGHSSEPPTPWLGLNTEEAGGKLVVSRAVPGGPAEKAGIKRGDIVTGIDGQSAYGLNDFYKTIRSRGSAGIIVPLDIERDGDKRRIDIKSMNRRDHLKLDSTL